MKTLNKLFIALIALGLITASACKKEETTDSDDNNNNNNPQFSAGNGSLSCKINGSTYTFDLEYCAFAEGTLNLGSFLENNAQIQFTPAAVGTFDMNIGGQGIQNVLFLVLDGGVSLVATSASITIDKLDGTCSGSFTASCVDMATGTEYTVTDGVFSANLFSK
jgi:hypothetical protein